MAVTEAEFDQAKTQALAEREPGCVRSARYNRRRQRVIVQLSTGVVVGSRGRCCLKTRGGTLLNLGCRDLVASPKTSLGLTVEQPVGGDQIHVFQVCLSQQDSVPRVAVVPIKPRRMDEMQGREGDFTQVGRPRGFGKIHGCRRHAAPARLERDLIKAHRAVEEVVVVVQNERLSVGGQLRRTVDGPQKGVTVEKKSHEELIQTYRLAMPRASVSPPSKAA